MGEHKRCPDQSRPIIPAMDKTYKSGNLYCWLRVTRPRQFGIHFRRKCCTIAFQLVGGVSFQASGTGHQRAVPSLPPNQRFHAALIIINSTG